MKAFFLVFIGLFATLFVGVVAHAQSASELQARAYVKLAEESYAAKKYSETINTLDEAERLLGGSNSLIEAMRAKAYYQSENYPAAQRSLERFYQSAPTDSPFLTEMARYSLSIEKMNEERRVREAAERKAQAEKERLERMEQEKQSREKAAAVALERKNQTLRDQLAQNMQIELPRLMKKCAAEQSCDKVHEALKIELKDWFAQKDSYSANLEAWFLKVNELKGQIIATQNQICKADLTNDCRYSYAELLRSYMLYTRTQDRALVATAFEIAENRSCNSLGAFNCVVDAALIEFLSGCDGKHLPSCQSALKDKKRIEKRNIPMEKSFAAYRKDACNLGDEVQCFSYALILFREGGRQLTDDALHYADKACSLGRSDACYQLAQSYWLGRHGLKENRRLSESYAKKMCNLGLEGAEIQTCISRGRWKNVEAWNLQ